MRTIEPIFVTPRLIERGWGRRDLGDWCGHGLRPAGPIGEAWIFGSANLTDKGPLSRRLAGDPRTMLGDLGRAPPRLRMVFPNAPTRIASTAPTSFWHVLEPGIEAVNGSEEEMSMALKPGERIRCYEGAALCLPSGATALEVSATFQPKNHAIEEPSVIRLPAVSRRARATMFRDPALSVELWRLPERSLIDPDGETCHVMVALTPGVVIDGRHLTQGEAIFVPAWGRPFQVQATHGQVLVAYPDAAPTTIWRDAPGPDPAAGQAPRPEPVRPPLSAVARHDVLAA